MLSDVITDRFDCEIGVDDWVVYIPYGNPNIGAILRYGRITKINTILMGGEIIVNIDGGDWTLPRLCIRFSPEEIVMRKLESGLGQIT